MHGNRPAKRERQRRWLARQRNGEVVCPVAVSRHVLHILIDLGWLQEHESADRNEVGRAIAALLEDALKI